jgi:hypothetical protein
MSGSHHPVERDDSPKHCAARRNHRARLLHDALCFGLGLHMKPILSIN